MAKNNKYICGINPKALEKYAKKYFKRGYRAIISNNGGRIYFSFSFFAAVIPAFLYHDILQPITMLECPKDGETIQRNSQADNQWNLCPGINLNAIFNDNFKTFPELKKTRVTYSVMEKVSEISRLRMFKSEKYSSAVDEQLMEIFDMNLPLYQDGKLRPIFGEYDTNIYFIVMPHKVNEEWYDEISGLSYDKSEEKQLKNQVDYLNSSLTAAQDEILRLKEELEKAQAAAKAAQEAQQAAEKHEEKQKREVMASPKERRITHKKENRPNKEQAAEKTDSKKEQAPKVMEVPDGKQSASMVEVIKSLESLFEKLNSKYFNGELVKPVITVQQDSTRGSYGWCTGWKAWRDNDGGGYYEINICAETLNRPLEQTAETLLHEMVHLYNIMHEVKDTSRGGTYHNTKYRDAAQAHGLVVEQGEKYGWHKTTLTEEALDWLHGTDFAGFTLCRPAIKKKPTASKSSSRKYVCPCCGAIVRATKDVRIICADCEEEMLQEE